MCHTRIVFFFCVVSVWFSLSGFSYMVMQYDDLTPHSTTTHSSPSIYPCTHTLQKNTRNKHQLMILYTAKSLHLSPGSYTHTHTHKFPNHVSKPITLNTPLIPRHVCGLIDRFVSRIKLIIFRIGPSSILYRIPMGHVATKKGTINRMTPPYDSGRPSVSTSSTTATLMGNKAPCTM